MKHIVRLLVLAINLTIGGVLAYILATVFGPLKWLIFIIVYLFLGEIIYRIDKWIAHIIKNKSN
ncbi:MAG: hypothetical protein K2O34_07205 [Acetatifactor sp.]|nr:hypothetical protein [Acetatifactor sp.]